MGPVRTSYGFHLVKLLDKKPLPTMKESRRELTKKVRRDSRADITRTSFLNKLKKEYGVALSERRVAAIQAAGAGIDSLFYPGHPLTGVRKSELNRTLFSIAGTDYKVSDFVYWTTQQKVRNLNRNRAALIDGEINRYLNDMLLAYEDTQLESKHDAFRLLMDEYHDGILFELTDQKVWSRAVKDTSGLEAYHASHREDFMWEERWTWASTPAKTLNRKKVRKTLKKTGDVEGLRRELIAERPLALRNEFGVFLRGETPSGPRARGAAIGRARGGQKRLARPRDRRGRRPDYFGQRGSTWSPSPRPWTNAGARPWRCTKTTSNKRGLRSCARNTRSKSTARRCTAWSASDEPGARRMLAGGPAARGLCVGGACARSGVGGGGNGVWPCVDERQPGPLGP